MYWKYIIKQFMIGLFIISLMVIMHECVHYVIFKIFQCDNIHFGATWGYFYTAADMNSCIYPEFMLLAHSINEVVGYTVIPILLFIGHIQYQKLMVEIELK